VNVVSDGQKLAANKESEKLIKSSQLRPWSFVQDLRRDKIRGWWWWWWWIGILVI